MIYKKSWKYILIKAHCLDDQYFGYRPKAIKDFSDVSKDDIGGYLNRGYHNLSQTGKCWVYDCATVSGDARVSENAVLKEYSYICDNVEIFGNAIISGSVFIRDEVKISGNVEVSENVKICKKVKLFGDIKLSGYKIIKK